MTDGRKADGGIPGEREFARAILVRAVVGVIAAGVAGLLLRLIMGARPDAGTVVGVVLLSACGLSLFLIQREALRAATILFLAVCWILVAGITLARGPSYPATLPLYLLLILLAGLLLDTRAALILAVASAIASITITVIDERNLLPEPEPIGLAYRALAGVVALGVVTATFTIALRRLRAALSELAQKNRELERARESLEGIVEARTKSLVDAREAAESASRAKSRFLANVSHELRTPLNAVVGMTDVLLASAVSEEQRAGLNTIREGGDALLSALNDVIDLSAVESGRLAVDKAAFDPRAVVEDVAALLQPDATRAGLALVVEVDSSLPRNALGDARRLRQVLLNLLSNAVKFTDHGEVRVRAARVGELLRFEVADTGAGIARGDLERIFAPFTQLDASPTRRRGGTGLGLSISRELASRLGGQLAVESEQGKGSSFSLELPFETPPEPTPLDEAAPGPRTTVVPLPTPPLPPTALALKILVAEDNEVNVRVLMHMLSHLGLKADVVGTGAAALHSVRTFPYDCILMDVHMPEMDGLEATRRIRAEQSGAGPAIIAVTADALPEQRAAVRAAGVDEVLTKPILLETLAGALARAAERRPKSGETA